MKACGGFTLIELSIVVAIVSVLAAVASQKLGDARRKAMEGATLGNLAILRAAGAAYYADQEGVYATDLQQLVPTFVNQIPMAMTWWHPTWNGTGAGTFAEANVAPGSSKNWWLVVGFNEPKQGLIFVNCDHRTMRGRRWYDEL